VTAYLPETGRAGATDGTGPRPAIHRDAPRAGVPGRWFADDVVGDTFLVAWPRLDSVPPVPLPWLLGVARNMIREH
jgi:hypothetical protein